MEAYKEAKRLMFWRTIIVAFVIAFVLLALVVVSVGAVAQKLANSLQELRSRAEELRALNEFGRELMSAQLGEEEICDMGENAEYT